MSEPEQPPESPAGESLESQRRAEAEARLAQSPHPPQPASVAGAEAIVHELQVHQIELEMQNEELRHAHCALQESRDKYLDLYDFSPLGYVSVTHGGRIVEANLTAAALLGVDRSRLLRQGLGGWVAPEDLPRWEQHLVAVRQSAERRSCELMLVRAGGSAFPARLDSIRLGRPGASAEGSSDCAVIRTALSDISERRRDEDALRRTHAQLEQRAAELRQTVDLLGSEIAGRRRVEASLLATQEQVRRMQKMEALGRLAGGIAHDFNNLLAAILAQSDLVVMSLEDREPEVRAEVGQIHEIVMRGATLTRQLLAISRRAPVQTRVLDLHQFVADLLPMLQRVIGEHIEFALRRGPLRCCIVADPDQMEQVLLNLVINARDAMPQGGRITLGVHLVVRDDAAVPGTPDLPPGRYARLTVTDTGVGMDAETLRHLFEPFFTTKERGKGTGLGLATVYGIVTQSGGTIGCTSTPGQGTTFEIHLPGCDEDAVAPKPVPTAPTAAVVGTETVLLVEDDNSVRPLAARILRSAGYTVLEAAIPAEGLRLAASHDGPIHLLMSDVVMPQMNGEELARRVRALRPGIKVIHVSGYADEVVLHNGRLAGGDGFLAKPFTQAELTQAARAVLDAPPTPR